jgi:hypothetical protein
MNRETLQPDRLLTSDPMPVVPSDAESNIQKIRTVKLDPKKSGWQAVRFRISSSEPSSDSALLTDNTISTCNSIRPPLEPANNGCMKARTQAESICRLYASSSKSETSSESSSSQPIVTFSTVKFHTHAVILGDNPSVSVGPPLAMGWKAVHSDSLDMEEYETSRPPRRQKRDLIIPKNMRVSWLRDEGYARSELAEVEDEIKMIKKYRKTNAHKGLWEKVRESMRSNDRSAQVVVKKVDDTHAKRRRRSTKDLMLRPSRSRDGLSAATA